MRLIKINTGHYVVVDDSEIKEDCWALHMDPLGGKEIVTANGQCKLDKKITHSTQPLEDIEVDKYVPRMPIYDKIQQITLSEVKELIGEVDMDKRIYDTDFRGDVNSYKQGYNQALEDNKEKKYTEEDVISIVKKSRETGLTAEYLLLSLQPKTSWEVEIVDGKLKLK